MFDYRIGQNSYSDTMNDKIDRYNTLVTQAKVTNRDNHGAPSVEEARLYKEAKEVCGEIMNLNLSQRAVYAKWKQQKDLCQAKLDQILDILDPPSETPPPAPAPLPDAMPAAEESRSAPVFPARPAARQAAAQPVKQKVSNEAGTVKTESGFTTKNATKEIPATMIESWYKEKPEETFDALVGVEDLKKELKKALNLTPYKRVKDLLKLDQVQSIFFYGPPGSGKSTVIKAFVHDLIDENDYKFIHLRGEDIRDSYVGNAEKKVAALFQEAIDNAPCVVFIDEIDGLCVDRTRPGIAGHEKNLTIAFMEAYDHLNDSHKPVVFIGATNHLDQIDSAMRNRMRTKIEIGLPGLELRQQYFEKRFKGLHLEEALTAEAMATETDGYSFRSLDELTKKMLEELGNQAVKENRREDADGNEDVEATDLASEKAIAEGTIMLTRAMFEEKKKLVEEKKEDPSENEEMAE